MASFDTSAHPAPACDGLGTSPQATAKQQAAGKQHTAWGRRASSGHGPSPARQSPASQSPSRWRLTGRLAGTVLLIAVGLCGPAAFADDFDDRSRPLFNGETLTGWEGNAYWFGVEEGAIVAGRLDENIPHNQFLCTTEVYDDFELRLEVKLEGEGNNAGVQFRSKRVPNSTEVAGFQMDVGRAWDRSVWGAIYDESRRRKMLAEPTAEVNEKITIEGWTKMRLICQGPRIQIFVNGVQTVDYTETDDSIPRVGVIGLQIHSGPPTQAWYRNLRILSMSQPAASTKNQPAAQPSAQPAPAGE